MFFSGLPLPCIIVNANGRPKRGRPENEARLVQGFTQKDRALGILPPPPKKLNVLKLNLKLKYVNKIYKNH